MRKHFKKIAYLAVVASIFSANAGSYDDFFRAVKGDNPSGVKSLIERGFDPNTLDPYKQPGLLVALKEPSPRVVKVLLESPKTNVDALNGAGESALMLAAIKGQKDVVNQLLARDAAVNKTGWTPLHYAASSGQLEIMKILLEKHAFIDAESPNGTTPLMMAAMYGSEAAVKLLLDEGADVMMKNQQNMTAVDFALRANRPSAAEMISAVVRTKAPRGDGKW